MITTWRTHNQPVGLAQMGEQTSVGHLTTARGALWSRCEHAVRSQADQSRDGQRRRRHRRREQERRAARYCTRRRRDGSWPDKRPRQRCPKSTSLRAPSIRDRPPPLLTSFLLLHITRLVTHLILRPQGWYLLAPAVRARRARWLERPHVLEVHHTFCLP